MSKMYRATIDKHPRTVYQSGEVSKEREAKSYSEGKGIGSGGRKVAVALQRSEPKVLSTKAMRESRPLDRAKNASTKTSELKSAASLPRGTMKRSKAVNRPDTRKVLQDAFKNRKK